MLSANSVEILLVKFQSIGTHSCVLGCGKFSLVIIKVHQYGKQNQWRGREWTNKRDRRKYKRKICQRNYLIQQQQKRNSKTHTSSHIDIIIQTDFAKKNRKCEKIRKKKKMRKQTWTWMRENNFVVFFSIRMHVRVKEKREREKSWFLFCKNIKCLHASRWICFKHFFFNFFSSFFFCFEHKNRKFYKFNTWT